MDRISVSSSSIMEVGYDQESQTLEIEFLKGSVYQYFNVPLNVFDELINASSKGQYFNGNIKDRFPCARVG
jgi:hypothetical protein